MDDRDAVLEELSTIRKLLVIAILNTPDMSQGKLADALGVNQSSISRMLSSKKKKG
jgi:predicted transcriptional regulator